MLVMRLSARADYALRAAVELAASTGDHTTAEQLARAQHIPAKFLEAILTQLRRAGLVRSQRGPEGGFWLAKPANEISLADIIRAVDGQLVGVRGERPENLGYIGAAEPLQSVWIALRANERAILDEVTLEHIVTGELPARVRELTNDPRAWGQWGGIWPGCSGSRADLESEAPRTLGGAAGVGVSRGHPGVRNREQPTSTINRGGSGGLGPPGNMCRGPSGEVGRRPTSRLS